ncbi:hypothetical protein JR316_0002546 [Psilocybe cubensis]|uniref:Uncharacterized protein n=2 Tax=Psilocybe cubensis TaxID=181762 RepID=A0ACB8HDU1_PSICU|nr:hypothetical protein JR316_0002546 [Psilocybe cubensis]KAH9485636.1 hypothetical protein JR316_0002546 [Psilocybe cubensis]
MAQKQNFPPFFLWLSIIISAISLGLTIPEARSLPIFVALMFFTACYHSTLLVSSLVNSRSHASTNGRSTFYMDPLEGAHVGWTLGFTMFWLTVFTLKFGAVVKGIAEEDKDIVLGILSGVESILNIQLLCWTIIKWRKAGTLWQSSYGLRAADDDLESGEMDDLIDEEDIMEIVQFLAEHMQRAGLTHCQHQCQHSNSHQYFHETPVKDDMLDREKENIRIFPPA